MKKAALIILALILSASLASAEDLQLSSMTDEALAELNRAVQIEMIRRQNNSFDLPAGVYIVGSDIPAGDWTITVVSTVTAEFIVYNSAKDKYEEYPIPDFDELMNASFDSDIIGKITLFPGNIVQISGKVHFDPFIGITKK